MKITSRFIYSHSYLQAFAEDLGLKNRFYQSRSFSLLYGSNHLVEYCI